MKLVFLINSTLTTIPMAAQLFYFLICRKIFITERKGKVIHYFILSMHCRKLFSFQKQQYHQELWHDSFSIGIFFCIRKGKNTQQISNPDVEFIRKLLFSQLWIPRSIQIECAFTGLYYYKQTWSLDVLQNPDCYWTFCHIPSKSVFTQGGRFCIQTGVRILALYWGYPVLVIYTLFLPEARVK